MKILVLTPFLPYSEATSGCPRTVFDRLTLLSADHELTVVTTVEPGELGHETELNRLDIKVYSLTRQPNQNKTGFKLWQKRIRLALGLFLDRRPMQVQEFDSPQIGRLIKEVTASQFFDLVLIEHNLMSQYTGLFEKSLPMVLSDHDPYEVLVGYSHFYEGYKNWQKPLYSLDKWKKKRYARQVCHRAATVVVPTREDAAALSHLVGGLQPEVIPLALPASHTNNTRGISKREQETLLFVGNFDHPPNVDATNWLCQEIMPLIWQTRPSVNLWLVGRNPPGEVRKLAGARVTVTGAVETVRPYLERCTLFVVPLRIGGGMRMKVLEALAAGAPIISTPLGVRGLDVEDGKQLLLAQSTSDFAAAVLRALDDGELRRQLAASTYDIYQMSHSPAGRLARLNEVLQRATGKVPAAQPVRLGPDDLSQELKTLPRRVIPEITVIISTLNRPVILKRCLNAFATAQAFPFEIIVVDQSSDQDTRQVVEAFKEAALPVRHLPCPERGLSRGRNLGIKNATTAIVAITDDDCVIAPEWLDVIKNSFELDEKHGRVERASAAVCGRILPLPTTEPNRYASSSRSSLLPRRFNTAVAPPWDIGSGGNMALRRAAVLEIGLYDERLGAGTTFRAGEDLDLLYRLQVGQETLLYEPAMLVYHETKTLQQRRRASYGYGWGAGAFCAKHCHTAGMPMGWLYIRMQGVKLLRGLLNRAWMNAFEALLALTGLVGGALGWFMQKRKSD